VRAALLRFRVIAYVVGALLLLLTLGVVLEATGHGKTLVAVVGPVHGFLYIGYLILGYDLVRRARWPIVRMLLIALAGIVPGLMFYAERRVAGEVARQQVGAGQGSAG
jgi:integral membrane protein